MRYDRGERVFNGRVLQLLWFYYDLLLIVEFLWNKHKQRERYVNFESIPQSDNKKKPTQDVFWFHAYANRT